MEINFTAKCVPEVSGKWWGEGIKTGYFDSVVFLYSSDGIAYEQNGQEHNFKKLAKFYNSSQNWHRLVIFFIITTEGKVHLV